MRSEDLSRLVGGKCEESGGKFEFWPDIKKAICGLDSTEGLPELIDFIRKIELPDDMERFVFEVRASTSEGDLAYAITKSREEKKIYHFVRADAYNTEGLGSSFYRIMRTVGKSEENRLREVLGRYGGLSRIKTKFGCDRKYESCGIIVMFDGEPYQIDPTIDREIIESAEKLWSATKNTEKVGKRTFIEI